MSIKKYLAPDMRAALRQIRIEQGPDAVILSTQKVPGGVEVCAVADTAAADIVRVPGGAASSAAVAPAITEPAIPIPVMPEAVIAPPVATAPVAISATASADTEPKSAEFTAMNEELRQLRRLLEGQLAALAWNDFTRREPQRAHALAELTRLGMARDIAWTLLQQLPESLSAEQAQHAHYALLAGQMRTCDSPVEQGGVIALIGPPGAGKSTTLMKLAVRWAVEHGTETLAIISTDNQRVGSTETTRTLGRLLNVESHHAADVAELTELLQQLADRQLVLVDTAGVNPRDPEGLAALTALCGANPAMIPLLVLPTSAQAAVIEDSLARFAPLSPSCAVLTRLDETVSLGGTLSALMRAELPVALISDGSRVPEDLRPARANDLVARAIAAARQTVEVDEDLLARRFGGKLNAAA